MSYTLFAGCSYTAGTGFDLEKDDPGLWVNMLHSNVPALKNTTLLNVSQPGRSNSGIFQDAVYNIVKYQPQYAFVVWTSVPRFEISLGVELYPTRLVLHPNNEMFDHNLHSVNYTKKYLSDIRDRLLTLVNEHQDIVNLLYYVNSLAELSKQLNCKLFFINALCPWDENYFTKLENVLPEAYTLYTKQLLETKTRNDEESLKLYNKIHTEYQETGGIQSQLWLNLYNSLKQQQLDTNSDSVHPGIKSNQQYYNSFYNQLISII